jgi:hypothetical protein
MSSTSASSRAALKPLPYDVGNATSFEWSGAVDGQQYYFSVSAYTPGPVLGHGPLKFRDTRIWPHH